VSARQWLALAIGLVAATGCIIAGLWQLDRREERRVHNETVRGRIEAAPTSLARLGLPDDSIRYRRVTVRGRWDYQHEIALTGRSRSGSPGVNIFTPLVPNGIDHAVLVNRGWAYAPDAATIDFDRFREGDSITFVGYIDLFPPEPDAPRDPRSSRSPRAWHRLDTTALLRTLPYQLEPYYVVALPDSASAPRDDRPIRLEVPELGAGPHLSYAVQWFSFATIALVGAGILIYKEGRRSSGIGNRESGIETV
jgi:surfeit locus 1 family protein